MSNLYQWSVYQTVVNAKNPADSVAFFNVLRKDDQRPCHVSGSCKLDLSDSDVKGQDDLIRLVKKSLGTDGVGEFESKLSAMVF